MKEDKITLKLIWFFVRRYKFRYMFLIGLALFIGILESLNVALVYPILAGGLGINTTGNPFLSFLNIFRKLIPIDDTLVAYCILFLILAILTVKTWAKTNAAQNYFVKFIDSTSNDVTYALSVIAATVTMASGIAYLYRHRSLLENSWSVKK